MKRNQVIDNNAYRESGAGGMYAKREQIGIPVFRSRLRPHSTRYRARNLERSRVSFAESRSRWNVTVVVMTCWLWTLLYRWIRVSRIFPRIFLLT